MWQSGKEREWVLRILSSRFLMCFQCLPGFKSGQGDTCWPQDCSQVSRTGQDQRSVFGQRTNLHPNLETRGDIL